MSESVVEISQLLFSWKPSAAPLLNIDSFEVARGEKVFLCGPSGSGKSTLLNLVGGVLSPVSGNLSRRYDAIVLSPITAIKQTI